MGISTIVQALNDATANPASITEADKAQLLGACTNVVSALQPFDQKLMDLLFAVSALTGVCTAANKFVLAAEVGRPSSRNRYATLRCMRTK